MIFILRWVFPINSEVMTHTLIAGLGDELPLTVNAGVRTLAGDPLLAFRHVARRWRATPRVLRTCEDGSYEHKGNIKCMKNKNLKHDWKAHIDTTQTHIRAADDMTQNT